MKGRSLIILVKKVKYIINHGRKEIKKLWVGIFHESY